MKKHLIIFLVLVILVLGVSQTFAQETQKIPADFFSRQWTGTIKGEEWRKDGIGAPCGTETKYSYIMKFLYLSLIPNEDMNGLTSEYMEYLKKQLGDKFPQQSEFKYKGWAEIKVKQEMFRDIGSDCTNKLDLDNLSAKVPIEVTFNLENGNSFWFDILSDEKTVHLKSEWIARLKSGEIAEHDKGESYASIKCFVSPQGGKFIVEKNKIVIKDKFERGNDEFWSQCRITGELHRIYVKKDTLGKTVQINEPIKADEFTQREIVVPNLGEVTVNTNSDGIFRSESELDLILGEIHSKIKSGSNYKVQMPQAVCGVRGTQFITKVEKDGTTILTVLDGEVEFSDIQKRKTVLVKKNQKSVCKPGGLPSEPVSIEPNQIPKWWE